MQGNEAILKRQSRSIRFKNADMDFMFNWAIGIGQVIGMSASQVFEAVHCTKDGDPHGWREGFCRQAGVQIEQAQTFAKSKHNLAAGQCYFGAAYAYRAALQYTRPITPEFGIGVQQMECAFQCGVDLAGVPMRPIEVPFENTTLPGYYLEHDAAPRPVILMVGGSDTFREDLFYFAGYPGWKRGYNVIMVDLPGQGITPNRGLHFRVDMDKAIGTVLDWLEANAAARLEKIAIYGVSGGGYFTTQSVATDARIKAWIASTPIFNMVQVFQHEFGNALKTPGWALNTFMKLSGALNEGAKINLEKYAWQFGTTDFKGAVDGVFEMAKPVNCSSIRIPSLFLMSEGEGDELKRQTCELFDQLHQRGVSVTLREFSAAEGADGHCQINNLRLAHMVIFDWLDHVFEHDPGDMRLRC